MDRRELLQRAAAGGVVAAVAAEPAAAAPRPRDPDGLPDARRLVRRGGPLNAFSAVELASLLRYRAVSSAEVTQACFEQIDLHNGPFERLDDNGAVNAFVRVFREEALAVAGLADARLSRRAVRRDGLAPPWTGIPVGLKDVLAVKGRPLTVGAAAYRGHIATGDATIVARVRDALMPLLGHTQAQAFTSGISTPQTGNPFNLRHIAGGSSGGSGAALAARMVPLTVGGETSGSIISPALCCGITGLKPSHGRVSLHGGWPGIPSVDVFGPMARTAADCALFLPVITGEDVHDPHTLAARPFPSGYRCARGAAPSRSPGSRWARSRTTSSSARSSRRSPRRSTGFGTSWALSARASSPSPAPLPRPTTPLAPRRWVACPRTQSCRSGGPTRTREPSCAARSSTHPARTRSIRTTRPTSRSGRQAESSR